MDTSNSSVDARLTLVELNIQTLTADMQTANSDLRRELTADIQREMRSMFQQFLASQQQQPQQQLPPQPQPLSAATETKSASPISNQSSQHQSASLVDPDNDEDPVLGGNDNDDADDDAAHPADYIPTDTTFNFFSSRQQKRSSKESYLKKKNRESIFYRADDDDFNNPAVPDTVMTHIRTTPPFKYTLNSLKIADIVHHVQQIHLYYDTHHVRLNIATTLSDSLIDIIAAHHNLINGKYRLRKLNNKDMAEHLNAAALPTTRENWIRDLKEAAPFPKIPSDMQLYYSNFPSFYRMCLMYTSEFEHMYNLLARADPHIVPPLWNTTKVPGSRSHQESVLGILLKGFPGSSGEDLHRMIIEERKPDTLKEYLSLFTQGLKLQLDQVHKAAPLSNMFYRLRSHKQEKELRQVHFLQAEQPLPPPSQPPPAPLATLSLPKTPRILSRPTAPDSELSAMDSKDQHLPCFKTMRGEHCNQNCGYSHLPADLEKARDAEIEKLRNANYSVKLARPSNSNTPGPRDRASGRVSDFHAVSNAPNSTLNSDLHSQIDDDPIGSFHPTQDTHSDSDF